MDVTRNWRLKTSRDHLLAVRAADNGALVLPQQTSLALSHAPLMPVYEFDLEAEQPPQMVESDIDLIRVAR